MKDKEATIGLTHFAQKQLGEIVHAELPEVGDSLYKDDEVGTVESVKAVSEIFSPVSGKVIQKNEAVVDDPSLINDDPYGEGWIIKLTMENADEGKELMTAADYDKYCSTEN
jgi:glycine cleavage system H protein